MSLLTQPNELKNKITFSGLIYGQPGIGKTTLALSAPNPVCIDTDKGMYRVEKRFQVPSLQVDNYSQVLELLNGPELAGFDTIVFDTLGKLIDRIADYVCLDNPKLRQADGQLAMKGWGAVKTTFTNLVKLLGSKGKSVIFVAHESEEKDGEATKKRPDVSGSARKDIIKELDWMGYMEASGNKRTICFSPTDKFYAKNSCGLDNVLEIPSLDHGNTFITDKILGAIKARQEQDNAELDKYNNIKIEINKLVANATAETLNEVKDAIAKLPVIWDSKIYAWHSLTEKATQLGATYNKETKLFEAKNAK